MPTTRPSSPAAPPSARASTSRSPRPARAPLAPARRRRRRPTAATSKFASSAAASPTSPTPSCASCAARSSLHAELEHPLASAPLGAGARFDGHLHVCCTRRRRPRDEGRSPRAPTSARTRRAVLRRGKLLALAHLHERNIAHHDVRDRPTCSSTATAAAALRPWRGGARARVTAANNPRRLAGVLAPEAVAITHLALQQWRRGYSTPADACAPASSWSLRRPAAWRPASPLDAAAQPSDLLFRRRRSLSARRGLELPSITPARNLSSSSPLQKHSFARPVGGGAAIGSP